MKKMALILIVLLTVLLACSGTKNPTQADDNSSDTSQTPGIGRWGPPTLLFSRVCSPTLTSDGLTIYFIGSKDGRNDVKVSYKVSGTWSEPVSVNFDYRAEEISVTGDGNTIYFVCDDLPIFWYSQKVNGEWQEAQPVPVDFQVYRNYNASILTAWDGRKIWISNSGSAQDIYYSTYINNHWLDPQPFTEINTSDYTEKDCSISGDCCKFYFISTGRPGYETYTIWATYLKNNVWQEPEPIIFSEGSIEFSDVHAPAISYDGSQLFFHGYPSDLNISAGIYVSNRID